MWKGEALLIALLMSMALDDLILKAINPKENFLGIS